RVPWRTFGRRSMAARDRTLACPWRPRAPSSCGCLHRSSSWPWWSPVGPYFAERKSIIGKAPSWAILAAKTDDFWAENAAGSNSYGLSWVILGHPGHYAGFLMVEQIEYIDGLSGRPEAQLREASAKLRAEATRARSAKPDDEGAPILHCPPSYWADLNAYDAA